MYAALWRALPGPTVAKALACIALFALVVVVCFTWLFPWVATLMPYEDVTVGIGPLTGGNQAPPSP